MPDVKIIDQGPAFLICLKHIAGLKTLNYKTRSSFLGLSVFFDLLKSQFCFSTSKSDIRILQSSRPSGIYLLFFDYSS